MSSYRNKGRGRGSKSQAERLQALRSSVDERINNICSDRSQWVNICRKSLLDMETRNIHRRAKHWTELVNEKVKDTNSRLNLDSKVFNSITNKFVYTVDNPSMKKHLGFIINWRGLKTRQIQNAPKTYLEFENKAKNWLNGRRAPNYAATLFPEMIKASEIYADYISRQIFANNPTHSKMYNKICVIGFLSSLCSARISLNDASKKAYLICENSVKTGKTQVSQILQRYASDHPYQDKFPSHLREASDFFENKYMELISDFGIQLNQKKRQEKLNYAEKTGGDVLDIINNNNETNGSQSDESSKDNSDNSSMQNTGGWSESGLPSSVTHSIMKDITNCDGNLNAISMSIDQFNKLAQFLSGMISDQKSQQNTINDLVQRVCQLETHQKTMIDVAVTSNNSPRSMDAPHIPHIDPTTQYSNNSSTHTTPSTAITQQVQPITPVNNGNGYINNGLLPPQPIQHRFGAVPLQRPSQIQLPNNGRISPSSSQMTKTTTETNTNTTPSQISQQYSMDNSNVNNNNINMNGMYMNTMNMNHNNMQPMQVNMNAVNGMNNMNAINNMNNMNNMNTVPPNMNVNATNMANMANMNRINCINNNNQLQRLNIPPNIPQNNVIFSNNNNVNNNNNNNNLPTTTLSGIPGSYDSNDGDANMFGFGNNQSFNSSDAGMNNMLSMPNNNNNNSNHQIPLDGGFGMPRFSDQSLNIQNIVNYNPN